MEIIRTLALFAVTFVLVAPQPATAQTAYPARPIRIISIFPPGGGNDGICRAVAQKITETMKQQVIVENRPGANVIIGTEAAARAAPDGYTITLIPSGHAVNASLYKKLPFDSIRDFTPLSLAGSSPTVLAVHPSLPVKNVRDLVTLAKARPAQLTYVSAGVGASGHLAGALFETMTNTKMVHIPYKGMSLAVSDLIGGQVSMSFGTSLSIVPHVRSGRLRALATTGALRSPALPDLPTVAESGVPGYEASLWYGFVGPAKLPAEIVQRLNAEIVAAINSPDVRERLTHQGVDARATSADEFAQLLVADLKRWADVVRRAGVTVE
jgi:tripartite-type tricarboxylate transporter receptor subunit TctC